VMDHMRKGALKLDSLETLVLDEADEMLRMGFIDDVEWILEQSPTQRQIALFSATMPKEIQQVANKYLSNPELVKIASKTTTAAAIRQRYWPVSGLSKLDALTRILEVEPTDGTIIFVRTKIATAEIAEKLEARGFTAAALNGDIPQAQRENTVEKMRKGKLDILVATDVAARGLDIPRISHVINYDIPFDTEAYVHRIGRTGRAGRTGEAILFVANRERRMLQSIERATRQPIQVMNLPSEKDINAQRVGKFKERIDEALKLEDLDFYRQLLTDYQESTETPAIEIAAALARLLQGDSTFLIEERPKRKESAFGGRDEARPQRDERKPRRDRRGDFDNMDEDTALTTFGKQKKKKESLQSSAAKPLKDHPDVPMERFRIAVGYADGVRPGHIVGAIANEADLESQYIGHIEIHDDFSTVDLPAEMPKEVFQHLKKVWVCQKALNISRFSEGAGEKPKRPFKPGSKPGSKTDFKPGSKPRPGAPKQDRPLKPGAPNKKKSPPREHRKGSNG
jgi:ATP-dependent RNA helicase DeaD